MDGVFIVPYSSGSGSGSRPGDQPGRLGVGHNSENKRDIGGHLRHAREYQFKFDSDGHRKAGKTSKAISEAHQEAARRRAALRPGSAPAG